MADWVVYDTEAAAATLPPSLSTAFYGWLHAPESPSSAFIVTIIDGETCAIDGYDGVGGDVIIPESIGGRAVTVIGTTAFRGNVALTSVTLPKYLTTISSTAFYGCSNLKQVVFNDLLETIGGAAFSACGSLAEVKLPASVTAIGGYAFCYTWALTSVIFLGGVPATLPDPNDTVQVMMMFYQSPATVFYLKGQNFADYFGETFFGRPLVEVGQVPAVPEVVEPRMVRLGLIVSGVVQDFRKAVVADQDATGKLDAFSLPFSCLRHVANIVWYTLAQECGGAVDAYRVGWQDSEIYLRRLFQDLAAGVGRGASGVVGTPAYAAGPSSYVGRSGGGGVAGGLANINAYVPAGSDSGTINYGNPPPD